MAVAEGLRASGAIEPRPADALLAELLAGFRARGDLVALGLILPARLADLGTDEDRTRLVTALRMVHAARRLPAAEQRRLGTVISALTGTATPAV
ncbi:hypothetical protein [Streptomyces sp. NPDC001985]|uniref:hypothetical protein n=1 Tax=Streptomyces sp. NPDC001985 TaxID=3154406 RepID=UPI0033306CA2